MIGGVVVAADAAVRRMGDGRGRIVGHARQSAEHAGDSGACLDPAVDVFVKEKYPPRKTHQTDEGEANTDPDGQPGGFDGVNRSYAAGNPKETRDNSPGSEVGLFSSDQKKQPRCDETHSCFIGLHDKWIDVEGFRNLGFNRDSE
mmetsp:Transcript_3194/g.6615  ORF Transcript_3194/g.6615 Transcript_3194/m.6615 type:complete len:145 (-) Transcript_3194:38-472(-)